MISLYKIIATLIFIISPSFVYSNQNVIIAYVCNPYKWSALNYAIEMNDFQTALTIAQTTPAINQKDPAAPRATLKINAIERLLYKARTTQSNLNTGLTEIQLKLIYELLERGISIDGAPHHSPLIAACRYGNKDLVRKFLDMGADVNGYNGIPFYFAVQTGDFKLVKYLIKRGADVRIGLPLNAAIETKNIKIAALLLKHKADIKKSNFVRHALNLVKDEMCKIDTCICFPLPDLDMLNYILEKGADPSYSKFKYSTNEDTIDGSPLGYALNLPANTIGQEYYKRMVIELLLKYGAKLPELN